MGQETGIDLGIEAFAILSDGTRIFSPGWYRQAERALKMAQRRVSRRKKGGHRRRKAVTLLAKAQQKVRRQRRDFHHKTALALVRQYDTISHEELQTATMLRNHHLAKSISDAGWSAFLSILSFKAACAGRSVVTVTPAFTSQMCSGCGVLVAKGLSVRWHACPQCGRADRSGANVARWGERSLRIPRLQPWGVSNETARPARPPDEPSIRSLAPGELRVGKRAWRFRLRGRRPNRRRRLRDLSARNDSLRGPSHRR
jgi:putative transposase